MNWGKIRMFESVINFFKKIGKQNKEQVKSKDAAKERLHLVLMQDRANVSADFLDLMKQEIIEVIKKYIDVDENAIDVRLTNKANGDGTTGAPALYANIPIVSIKEEVKTGMARQQDEPSTKKKAEKVEETKKEKVAVKEPEEQKAKKDENKLEQNSKKEEVKEDKAEKENKKKEESEDFKKVTTSKEKIQEKEQQVESEKAPENNSKEKEEETSKK